MLKILKLPFSTQVFIALCSGIFIGLFFGESVAWLNIVGKTFIKLLQISIVPYIVLSLVTGLGSLSYLQAKEIARKFTIMLLSLWLLGLITIFLLAQSFPEWTSKDFFSTSQIITAPKINYLDLYIPSNPFKSLADNTVPAIVVFSLFLGIALVDIKNKEQFITPSLILLKALNKITKKIIVFLPIGIFAISAAAADTLQGDDFEKLGIYFIVYISTALILSFWIMPFFISTITPFKYTDIVQECRNILITAFASGNIFILIPVITDACNAIFAKHQLNTSESDKYNEIIIPIAYNFPGLGKFLAFTFILFSAWFSNSQLTSMQQLALAINGTFSLFAKVHISVPFLLNYVHLPSDLYQLFLSADILTKRFSTLTAAIFLISLTLTSSAYLVGLVEIKLKKVSLFLLSCTLIIATSILGSQFVFNTFFQQKEDLAAKLKHMQVDWDVPQSISYQLIDTSKVQLEDSTPEAIINRGTLRIAYHPAHVPFSFYNIDHKLVGFDIEMMNHLSSSLNVALEFYPFSKPKEMYQALNNYQVDIIISGVRISNEYLGTVLYTQATMNLTTALIVKDYRKNEFSNYSKFDHSIHLNLATTDFYPRLQYIEHTFPNIQTTKISSPKVFFDAKDNSFDGFITSVEEGMTLVMLHPEYTVAFDPSKLHRFPVGYAVHKNNLKLQSMLNSWLEIQKSTGNIDYFYDYWIQGKGAKKKTRRWSILRNVINKAEDTN